MRPTAKITEHDDQWGHRRSVVRYAGRFGNAAERGGAVAMFATESKVTAEMVERADEVAAVLNGSIDREELYRLWADCPGEENMVRSVGELVAERAEELAGITAEQARSADLTAQAQARREVLDNVEWQRLTAIEDAAAERLARATVALDDTVELRENGSDDDALAFQEHQEARSDLASIRRLPEIAARNEVLRIAQGGETPERREALARLADGYREALAEVRDMSGTADQFHPNSTKTAVAAFTEAAADLPADWNQLSNEGVPMIARHQNRRAHYSHSNQVKTGELHPIFSDAEPDQLLPIGERPERTMEMDWRAGHDWVPDGEPDANGNQRWKTAALEYPTVGRGQQKEYDRRYLTPESKPKGSGWQWRDDVPPPGWRRLRTNAATEQVAEIKTQSKPAHIDGISREYTTAIHELGHRAEFTVPKIAELEHSFLARRWANAGTDDDEPTRLYPSTPGNGEVARDGEFAGAYTGKIYPEPLYSRAATEVLSTGLESLFGGSNGGLVGLGRVRADLDHRAFVLGVLATAGRPASSR